MIIIFDLDDTLFDESTFVEGGFKAVSSFMKTNSSWNYQTTLDELNKILLEDGRGKIFDKLLYQKSIKSKNKVKKLINIYRYHKPNITLHDGLLDFLLENKKPLYLVTDGHKIVQRNKINALGISHFFKKFFITHQYGIKYRKPSIYCFEKIKKIENCKWSDMVYVGDNPNKDFVNLKKMGVRTIRILTGEFKSIEAKKGYDAEFSIPSPIYLPLILKGIN